MKTVVSRLPSIHSNRMNTVGNIAAHNSVVCAYLHFNTIDEEDQLDEYLEHTSNKRESPSLLKKIINLLGISESETNYILNKFENFCSERGIK